MQLTEQLEQINNLVWWDDIKKVLVETFKDHKTHYNPWTEDGKAETMHVWSQSGECHLIFSPQMPQDKNKPAMYWKCYAWQTKTYVNPDTGDSYQEDELMWIIDDLPRKEPETDEFVWTPVNINPIPMPISDGTIWQIPNGETTTVPYVRGTIDIKTLDTQIYENRVKTQSERDHELYGDDPDPWNR